MVEGARLESVCAATYRGFESLSLRHYKVNFSSLLFSDKQPLETLSPGGPMLELKEKPTMQDLQQAVYDLEAHHGWLNVDLIHNCFLMGEEVGELFKAVRQQQKFYDKGASDTQAVDNVAEEIVDVLNYLLAIANRLDIDVETAFRKKNGENMQRTWE